MHFTAISVLVLRISLHTFTAVTFKNKDKFNHDINISLTAINRATLPPSMYCPGTLTASHLAVGILFETCVEDRVWHLIAQLVCNALYRVTQQRSTSYISSTTLLHAWMTEYHACIYYFQNVHIPGCPSPTLSEVKRNVSTPEWLSDIFPDDFWRKKLMKG